MDRDLEKVIIVSTPIDQAFEISKEILIFFLAATQVLSALTLWNGQLIAVGLSSALTAVWS